MGTRLLVLEELGLWSTSQSSLWIWSLHQKIGVAFPLSLLWGYFPFNNTLCNKYCLLILPWFVVVCEIWLPGLTYSVCLVLFLKPGATREGRIKSQGNSRRPSHVEARGSSCNLAETRMGSANKPSVRTKRTCEGRMKKPGHPRQRQTV